MGFEQPMNEAKIRLIQNIEKKLLIFGRLEGKILINS